jgi:hypothetical protein
MSKRRKAGDLIRKKAGAGFSGIEGAGRIRPGSEPEDWPCLLCGDPECREWPDVWGLHADGEPNGEMWCHVSECELEDFDGARP